MTQKFVLRLLDADDQLLAWTTVYAAPRPQGRPRSCPFYPIEATWLTIERDGIASKVTIHWCDLDLARVGQPIEAVHVSAGQRFLFTWIEPVWLVPTGGQDVPLPTVTERQSVTVAVPTAQLGVTA
jgi:hypothetical protein